MLNELGSGSFAKVHKCVKLRDTKEMECAVKVISLRNLRLQPNFAR